MDLRKNELIYIDPFGGPSEKTVGTQFVNNWQHWAHLWNDVTNNTIATKLKLKILPHAIQNDVQNCGIFTMCVSIIVYINLTSMCFCRKEVCFMLLNYFYNCIFIFNSSQNDSFLEKS